MRYTGLAIVLSVMFTTRLEIVQAEIPPLSERDTEMGRVTSLSSARRGEMVSLFSTDFAGRSWWVKEGDWLEPNANLWRASNVNVDEYGLHLRISPTGECGSSPWSSAEVWLKDALGYGTYVVQTSFPLALDPAAVFGVFTWDDDNLGTGGEGGAGHREIDFTEVSRWGQPEQAANAQFAVQPVLTGQPENLLRISAVGPVYGGDAFAPATCADLGP